MTLRELLKTSEAIIVIGTYVLIILSGWLIWAWVGIIAYFLVNVEGGIDKVIRVYKWIKNLFK